MRPVFVTLTAIAALGAAPAMSQTHSWGEKSAGFEPAFENQTRAPLKPSDYSYATNPLVEGVEHPWAIEALPADAGYLVTERPGDLRHVSMDGTVSDPISGLPEIFNRGTSSGTQAGLLDVKVGPTFEEDRYIYFTYSKGIEGDSSVTAAGRGKLNEDMTELTEVEDIFVQTPPSPVPMHYGSRIVFDDDGHAFITTGEHFTVEERQRAQSLDNTYGKVVRVNLDGSIPQDNPFVGDPNAMDSIWSYGHRNIQGAAMRDDGTLFTLEHGPAGGDEINIPVPGENYGWPIISYGINYDGSDVGQGISKMDGMQQPAYYWDPVIAPGDMTFYEGEMFSDWDGDLLIGGLVSPGIVRLDWDGDRVAAEERLLTQFGRVRDVEVLDDGSFLIATDYEDGQIVHVTRGEGES